MTIRLKALGILTLLSVLVFALVMAGVIGLGRVTRAMNLVVAERVPIFRSSEQARLAVVSGAGYMDRALRIQDPERLDEVRVLEGRFGETMVDFDMFIKAMIWGSESEEFRNSSGGLTFAQWQRRGWHEKMVVKQEVEPH